MNFGGWGAPFGVTFVADAMSAALCTVAGTVALAWWQDVSALLSEPGRVREEYRRRLEGPRGGEVREANRVAKLINHVRTTISRLIDAYGDGLLDKSEFEPRIRAAD